MKVSFKEYSETFLWKGIWSDVSMVWHLNNYFGLHVSLSNHDFVSHTLGFYVASQNVINKSFFVCVKSEKYAFLVTLRPLGSMQQGKAKLRTIHYQARQSQALYIRTHFSVLSLFQCQSQAVVWVSTPWIYPQSRYFLVFTNSNSGYL